MHNDSRQIKNNYFYSLITNFYFYLFLILVIAFVLRLYISNYMLNSDISIANPLFGSDMEVYKKLALEISRSIYPSQYTYQPFYYAVFLASIFRFLGTNISYVLFMQSLLGALTVLFAALTAKSLWNKKTALITAVLVTFSHILIFYTPYMLIVTLQAFWLSLILYLAILAYKRHNLFIYTLLGLTLGCSILTRGNIWILVPMFIILSLYGGIKRYYIQNKRKPVLVILPAVLLIIFLLLPQIPFIIQNSTNAGSLRGSSDAGIIVFGFGNLPDSPPGGLQFSDCYNEWVLNSSSSVFFEKYFKYVKNNKLSYLDHTFNKLLLFWDYKEIPNNADINMQTKKNSVLKLGFVTTPIIIILGLAGIFLFLPFKKEKRIYLVPFFIVFFYWISIGLFYILARFRAPLIPVLSIYAGGIINYILFTKPFFKIKKWCSVIILLIISIFITYFSYYFYSLDFEPYISNIIRPYGNVFTLGNNIHIADNAPIMHSTLKPLMLKRNEIITKKFLINTPAPHNIKDSILQLEIYSDAPSLRTFEINKKIVTVKLKTGLQKITLKAPPLMNKDKNGIILTFNIKILKGENYQFFILDKQRNYRRTLMNDEVIPYELDSKLIIPINN
ncbi:MAG: hypothetical protein GY756_01065 [bacterium]|nr:hypothetical protein [bacterium]